MCPRADGVLAEPSVIIVPPLSSLCRLDPPHLTASVAHTLLLYPKALWPVKVLVTQSCAILCDPWDCGSPGSSLHGISQSRILEWVAVSSSRASSQPRDWTQVSCIVGRFFTIWATREAHPGPWPCSKTWPWTQRSSSLWVCMRVCARILCGFLSRSSLEPTPSLNKQTTAP